MNYAAADLHLAIAHHLLIFLLAGILAFEIGVIRLTMIGADMIGSDGSMRGTASLPWRSS